MIECINKNKYSKEFELNYSYFDCNFNLKPSVLLHLLQDIASEDAKNSGFGFDVIQKYNLAWYLLKYKIEFYDCPKEMSKIRIETESRGYSKLFAYRDFEIFYLDKKIIKVSSCWALIDKNTSKIANIKDFKNELNILEFQKRDDDLKLNSVPSICSVDIEKQFEVRFDDIDINQHANNSNYLIWALETLDFNFRKRKIKSITINYKKEIAYGEKLISQTEINKEFTNHVLKSLEKNEILCLIYIEWD